MVGVVRCFSDSVIPVVGNITRPRCVAAVGHVWSGRALSNLLLFLLHLICSFCSVTSLF